jgi:uncharacterized protein (DUF1778 family)
MEQFIEKKRLILVSERDKKVFFSALLNTSKPNNALIKAATVFVNEIKKL